MVRDGRVALDRDAGASQRAGGALERVRHGGIDLRRAAIEES